MKTVVSHLFHLLFWMIPKDYSGAPNKCHIQALRIFFQILKAEDRYFMANFGFFQSMSYTGGPLMFQNTKKDTFTALARPILRSKTIWLLGVTSGEIMQKKMFVEAGKYFSYADKKEQTPCWHFKARLREFFSSQYTQEDSQNNLPHNCCQVMIVWIILQWKVKAKELSKTRCRTFSPLNIEKINRWSGDGSSCGLYRGIYFTWGFK